MFYIGADDYTAADGNNDFLAVYLDNSMHVVFAFDAGDGLSAVTSRHPLKVDRWQSVKIYRTGLLAEIQVDDGYRVSTIGKGAFTQVILRTKGSNGRRMTMSHSGIKSLD